MFNKIDKIFIGATLSVAILYLLPFLIILGIITITTMFKLNTPAVLSMLPFTVGVILFFVAILASIISCQIVYFVLFWTLYKKIKEPQKAKKDYLIIILNILAIIFYSILACISWYFIFLPLVYD